MDIHILPVGFDRDRLVAPLGRGGLPADRVIILNAKTADAKAPWAALTARLLANVKRDLALVSGLSPDDIVEVELPSVRDYEALYATATDLLVNTFRSPETTRVHINVSSMPRTVSFAFAAAAIHLPTTLPGAAGRVHLYYVPAAEYLVNGLLSTLQDLVRECQDLKGGAAFQTAVAAAMELLADAEAYGQTKGVRHDAETGECWVTLPLESPGELRDVERLILDMLFHNRHYASVSDLATSMATTAGHDVVHVKSKVIYNVGTLQEKGLISLLADGRRRAPALTAAGRLMAHGLEIVNPHDVQELPGRTF